MHSERSSDRIAKNSLKYLLAIDSRIWMLVIGTFFLRTESELILKSRFVKPKRLLDSGFSFKFENVEPALHNLIHE